MRNATDHTLYMIGRLSCKSYRSILFVLFLLLLLCCFKSLRCTQTPVLPDIYIYISQFKKYILEIAISRLVFGEAGTKFQHFNEQDGSVLFYFEQGRSQGGWGEVVECLPLNLKSSIFERSRF